MLDNADTRHEGVRYDRLGWPAFALAVGLVVAPENGHAGFIDCMDILRNGQEQIVVGDVTTSTGGDAAAAELTRRRLQQRLRQQLADLAVSLGGAVYTASCPGHSPHISDYTPEIVASRNGAGVLVELWGVASGTDAGITYALLPLFLPANQDAGTIGFYDLNYSISSNGGIADVFAEATELRAFTALSAGLRDLSKAKQTPGSELYNLAYAALCRASNLLSEAERRSGSDGLSPNDWKALRSLALKRAHEAQTGAAAIGKTDGGALAVPPTGVFIGNCDVAAPDPPLAAANTNSAGSP